jgi:chromosome transmission fidelity protein 1
MDQAIVDPNLLLKGKGADQVNLFKLIKYIHESKLAYKVESYASYVEESESASTNHKSSFSSPVLHTLQSFLSALTNLSTEGRVFCERTSSSPPDIKLSYLLLSPTHAFSSIATEARAIILAGGTMSPFDDYKAHLFPSLHTGKITTLSCGHVIPADNLCVWTLGSMKPANSVASHTPPDAFEFSFQKRSGRALIRQLGLAILNICSIVPDGVVVFFPSYGYLDEVVQVWQSPTDSRADGISQDARPLWDRLQTKKAVFRESKGGSSDEVLQEYSAAILGDDAKPVSSSQSSTSGKAPSRSGALLLSVVGGKMSEGINFSDRLGRCVVIVGLPYPNINSPEWKARTEYIESSTLERLTSGIDTPETTAAVAAAKQAARDFYENACMRAVNQSIGRAIRHQNDYAAIVLVDRRFSSPRIQGKLPGWIRGGMVKSSEDRGIQGLMGALNGFFRGKKSRQ